MLKSTLNILNRLKIQQCFSSGYPYMDPQQPATTKYSESINKNFGNFERVAGFVGESLLDCLTRHQVENVVAICKGGEDINKLTEKPVDPVAYGPFCSSCHVVIAERWRNQMGDLHYYEENNLRNSDLPTTKKLACCFTLEKWMDEMIVQIGGNQSIEVG